jgi:hypothetical protein
MGKEERIISEKRNINRMAIEDTGFFSSFSIPKSARNWRMDFGDADTRKAKFRHIR